MGIKVIKILLFLNMSASLSACYKNNNLQSTNSTVGNDSVQISDALTFYQTHHYGIGYNFIVKTDSLLLISQQPEEYVSQLVTDTFVVKHNQQVAVSDIRIIPQDSIDSVWVQIITDNGNIGWNHESEMLSKVMPTDPISQFIMFFSDTHFIIALIILTIIIAAYLVRIIQKRKAPIIHFRDIPSFYPTLLCITVAYAATLYASLQMFDPDTWQYFYYHPSLNPFSLPKILGVFILSVWVMLIIGIAAIEDIRHHLSFNDMALYIAGLCGACAILYIVFSISTLYYIGYPLLLIYTWFAIAIYRKNSQKKYICGKCGKRIESLGRCPYCNTINE